MDGCPFHSSWPSSASRKMWRALQTSADGVARHAHLSEGRQGVETRASACRSANGQDGASHGPAEVTTTRDAQARYEPTPPSVRCAPASGHGSYPALGRETQQRGHHSQSGTRGSVSCPTEVGDRGEVWPCGGNPALASVMAQNSPNRWSPTPRNSLTLCMAVRHDGSKRPIMGAGEKVLQHASCDQTP